MANAVFLHLLRREDLSFILSKIRNRLRLDGLLFIRIIQKIANVNLQLEDPIFNDLTYTKEKEILSSFAHRNAKEAIVDLNEIMPLVEKGELSSATFELLLSKATPLEGEMDGHERGDERWFVYFTLDELRKLAGTLGYQILEDVIHPHRNYKTVSWLSMILKKIELIK